MVTLIVQSIATDRPVQLWIDPDQMPQNAASDKGLYCLALSNILDIQQQVVEWTLPNLGQVC